MRIILSSFLFFFLCWPLFGQTKEEYEIYSRIIDDYLADFDSTKNEIIIIRKFDSEEEIVDLQYELSLLESDTSEYKYLQINVDSTLEVSLGEPKLLQVFKNFVGLSEKKSVLRKPQFISQIKTRLVFSWAYKRYFFFGVDSGWNSFYQDYPKSFGVMEFSPISIIEDVACVYFSHRGGGLFGGGQVAFLRRKEGKWKLIGYMYTWIS